MHEQEHFVQDPVDLNLRVPLEKEIPVTILPEEKEDAKSADNEEEFPEITEVDLHRLLTLEAISRSWRSALCGRC